MGRTQRGKGYPPYTWASFSTCNNLSLRAPNFNCKEGFGEIID